MTDDDPVEAALAPWRNLCEHYGLPFSPDALVRHLESGAALRATCDTINECHRRHGSCQFLNPEVTG